MIARRTLLLSLVASLAAASALAQLHLQTFATAPLTIVGAGEPHHFTVELAVTPEQMEQGLMYRRALAPDAGMLFDFKEPTVATMWMKNTLIPLDMLFVDEHGRIVNIRERAVPESLAVISSTAPVRVVIELNGGTVARLGIKPGDEVRHPIFGNAS